MRQVLLFIIVLLWANVAKAQFPLHRGDSIALALLKDLRFIDSNVVLLDPLTTQDYVAIGGMNDAGIVLDIVNSEWRVSGLRLNGERLRQVNALPLLPVSAIEPAFSNGSLEMVKILYLANSGLTEDFNNFPMVDSLRQIDFHGNQLTNVDRLVDLHSVLLEQAIFNQNQLTNIPPNMFRDCPNLEDVSFAANIGITALPVPDTMMTRVFTGGFTVVDLPFYRGLAKLKYLKLQEMGLTGTFYIEHFLGAQLADSASSRPLEELRINNNDIDNISDYCLQAVLNSTEPVASCLNSLGFPALQPTGVATSIFVQNNRLDFNDLSTLLLSIGYDMTSGAINFMSYSPQDSLGVGGVRRRGAGQLLNFSLEAESAVFANRNEPTRLSRLASLGFTRDNYVWKWGPNLANIGVVATYTAGGTATFSATVPSAVLLSSPELRDTGAQLLRPSFRMVSNQGIDESFIFTDLTNSSFPALTLSSKKKMIIFGDCFDSLGQVIQCQEMSIQFDDTTSAATREAARRDFGAKVVSSCVCNKIELWELSDTFQSVSMEANGAGTRQATTQASIKPGLKSADPNYPLLWTTPTVVDTNPNIANSLATVSASRHFGSDYRFRCRPRPADFKPAFA